LHPEGRQIGYKEGESSRDVSSTLGENGGTCHRTTSSTEIDTK